MPICGWVERRHCPRGMTILKKSTHPYKEGGPELGIPQSHVRRKSKGKEKEMQIITDLISMCLLKKCCSI